MLKLTYLFENFDLARQCLAFYDYEEKSLEEMLSYFRISSNAVYPFRSGEKGAEVCFLRLSPSEEKAFSHVTSEIRLIQWLREKGFPAMRPVAMKNGELAGEISTQWGNYNVSCFANVPGRNLEDTKGDLDIVKGYGKTLGKLHNLLKTYPYSKEWRGHRELLEEIGERLRKWNAPDGVKQEFDSLCEELECLSISNDQYGVIHYDFEPDNVYYDLAEKAFSVIDFDDAIQCWYALDIVRALDGLEDVVGEEDIARAEICFLEGYGQETVLTDAQRKSFPLMRRLVRIQEYATLLYVLSEPMEEQPDWMVKLIEKLRDIMKRLETAMGNE